MLGTSFTLLFDFSSSLILLVQDAPAVVTPALHAPPTPAPRRQTLAGPSGLL